jgi:putative oxidoreductase
MSATSITTTRTPRWIGVWILQAVVAVAFFAAGGAKLAGAPFMVQLFTQIGIGQWFRLVTGTVEVLGGVALLTPGAAFLGGVWLGFTMLCAVATHVFILHTNPAPAIVLALLNASIVYLRRDELASFWRAITRRV